MKPRVPELDGIRGAAILLVLIWHYGVCQIRATDGLLLFLQTQLNLTWSGVDLFFVLSGFLLGGILVDHRESPNLFKVFYVRRALRILPLYFALFFSFLFVTYALRLDQNRACKWLFQDPLPLWSYALFTQNFLMAQEGLFGSQWLGVTWSLAVEEQFYLVLPLLIRLIPRARLPQFLLGLILSAPILRVSFYLFHPHAGYPGYLLMPARADALLLGVLGACWMRSGALRSRWEPNLRWLYGSLAILLLGVAAMNRMGIGILSFGMMWFGHTWLALFYLCLILIACTEKSGVVTRCARNPALRWLGRISYGVYMYHQVVSGLVHGLILKQSPRMQTPTDALVTVLALVLTILLSAASWRFFEKGLIDRGHSLKYQ